MVHFLSSDSLSQEREVPPKTGVAFLSNSPICGIEFRSGCVMLDWHPMGGRADTAAHVSAISKINSVAKHAAEIREHVEQVIQGPAFKGSHRGQSFLRHVVERSLTGDFEGLRERSIGVELFGKSASYDTGEDAVVRVTASDVRKRLLQHYGGAGSSSKLRVEIPSGSYLPEFHLPDKHDSPAQLEATPSTPAEGAAPVAQPA